MTTKSGTDNERRQKKEVIFQILIKDGFFMIRLLMKLPNSDHLDRTSFIAELAQKPKKTIGAFQQSRLLFLKKQWR
jgi:hypothetical protein